MNSIRVETGHFSDQTYQMELWNRQHFTRGGNFGREDWLKFIPTQSAVIFNQLIPSRSRIIEVGSGNGRDARFWASQGHSVVCVDFSEVAIRQLSIIAQGQGIAERITPVLHDISTGLLPFEVGQIFDGFYARSALHVSDNTMIDLAKAIDYQLKPGGKILVLGKSLYDIKIQRSKKIDGGLAIDCEENGHMRRIWSEDFIKYMCSLTNWELLSVEHSSEIINREVSSYITMIAKKHE
jgi:SAM-dependent methyltransferase